MHTQDQLIGRLRIEQGRATLTNSGAGELPITANATAWVVVRSRFVRAKRHLQKSFNAEFAKERRKEFKQYRFQTLKLAVNAFVTRQKANGLLLDEAYTDEQTSVSPDWREAVQAPRQQETGTVPRPPDPGPAGD